MQQLDISREDFEREGYFVQLGNPPARIDILMSIKGVKFEEAWKNKVVQDLDGIKINLISKQDLIVSKKATGKPQDLVDADPFEKN